MTQHVIRYEQQERVVLIGWDRPLQGYFLVVEDFEENPIYCNLDDVEAHPKHLQSFIDVLARLNLPLSKEIESELVTDKLENIGNKCAHWVYENGFVRRLN